METEPKILDCGHEPSPHESQGPTGYGIDSATGATFCYACAADRDRADMIASGRATLYMVQANPNLPYRAVGPFTQMVKVTNWPGSLEFMCGSLRVSRHNIAGKRYDAWFIGPDGWEWHAVTYGDNTQIAHCRRVTSRNARGRRLGKGEVRPS